MPYLTQIQDSKTGIIYDLKDAELTALFEDFKHKIETNQFFENGYQLVKILNDINQLEKENIDKQNTVISLSVLDQLDSLFNNKENTFREQIEKIHYYGDREIKITSLDKFQFVELNSDNKTATIKPKKNVSFDANIVIPYKYENEEQTYIINKIIGFGGKSISKITLPNSIQEIGENAFSGCSNLKTIVLSNNIKLIGANAFAFTGIVSMDLNNLEQIEIGSRAFQNCANLTTITLPLISTIPSYCFSECSKISNIDLPVGVETIGERAFENCNNLKYIDIPNSVNVINNYAFYGCSSLTTAIIPKNVVSIGKSIFSNTDNLTIICEENSAAATYANNNNIDYKSLFNNSAESFYYFQCDTLASEENKQIPSIKDNMLKSGVKFIIKFTYGNTAENITINNEQYPIYSNNGKTEPNLSSLKQGQLLELVCQKNGDTIYFIYQQEHLITNDMILDGIIENEKFEDKSITTNKIAEDKIINIEDEVAQSYIKSMSDKQKNKFYYGDENIEPTPKNYFTTDEYGQINGIRELPTDSKKFREDNFTKIIIPYDVKFNKLNEGNIGKEYVVEVILPSNITSISKNAFSNMTKLQKIKIPDSVEYIYEEAFYGCTALKNVKLPKSLFALKRQVFSHSGIENIIIPKKVTFIPDFCFEGCASLKIVNIVGENFKTIGQSAFYDCKELVSINIPNSVNTIMAGAFQRCEKLENINLPLNLTTIDSNTFNGCTALQSIKIPDKVTHINAGAFVHCKNLSTLIVPSSIKVGGIDDGTFRINNDTSNNITFSNGANIYCSVNNINLIKDIVPNFSLIKFHIIDDFKKNFSTIPVQIGTWEYKENENTISIPIWRVMINDSFSARTFSSDIRGILNNKRILTDYNDQLFIILNYNLNIYSYNEFNSAKELKNHITNEQINEFGKNNSSQARITTFYIRAQGDPHDTYYNITTYNFTTYLEGYVDFVAPKDKINFNT